MISLQSSTRMILLTVSILTIIITFVSGQVMPVLAQTTSASSNLEKRNYSYLDDQHLTARFGNNKVCGDHLCAPGEWSKLRENLNQAQISHAANVTTAKVPPLPIVPPSPSVNSTVPSKNMTLPQPLPTPPTISPSVCSAVKAALGNSTSSSIIAKIMDVLGCNK